MLSFHDTDEKRMVGYQKWEAQVENDIIIFNGKKVLGILEVGAGKNVPATV